MQTLNFAGALTLFIIVLFFPFRSVAYSLDRLRKNLGDTWSKELGAFVWAYLFIRDCALRDRGPRNMA